MTMKPRYLTFLKNEIVRVVWRLAAAVSTTSVQGPIRIPSHVYFLFVCLSEDANNAT
jgi:hypothetical protein